MLICSYGMRPAAHGGGLGRHFLSVAKGNPEHRELRAQGENETVTFPCNFLFGLVSEWFDYTQPINPAGVPFSRQCILNIMNIFATPLSLPLLQLKKM